MKQKFIANSLTIVWLSVFFLCCTPGKSSETKSNVEAYKVAIDSWHKNRVVDLQGSAGWLNVAGLFWLKEGINTFGSGQVNSFTFPEGKIAEKAGSFFLRQGKVTMRVAPGVDIMIDGKSVSSAEIFNPDSTRSVKASSGSLEWIVIKRDLKHGIRLRDFANPELEKFRGINRYEVDITWQMNARVEKTEGRTISITNVLGQTTEQPAPGTLVFSIKGEEYRLDALDEGGDELFIIFGDATNAFETYGAGRYLYVKKPDASNMTVIDFNKAYNPPCAFTEFATCPLPPRQNVLLISVLAGEKNYSNH